MVGRRACPDDSSLSRLMDGLAEVARWARASAERRLAEARRLQMEAAANASALGLEADSSPVGSIAGKLAERERRLAGGYMALAMLAENVISRLEDVVSLPCDAGVRDVLRALGAGGAGDWDEVQIELIHAVMDASRRFTRVSRALLESLAERIAKQL